MEALVLYDVETATVPSTLDLGAAAPGSSDDSLLRVVNISDLYQAEDVAVTVTGADAINLWLSDDGDTFRDTLLLGDIPPGGSSITFWLRRTTPSTAVSGAATGQIVITPVSWTNPVDSSTSTNIPLETP